MKLEKREVQRVYDAGMQLAEALRKVGKDEEAVEMEIWILALCGELEE